MVIKGYKVGAVLKETGKAIWRDNILTLAAAVAYNFFFSLFPLLCDSDFDSLEDLDSLFDSDFDSDLESDLDSDFDSLAGLSFSAPFLYDSLR